MITTVLDGLIGERCLAYVDDVVVWASDPAELLDRLELILGRFMEVGLFTAARKVVFLSRTVRWCGKIFSGNEVCHDQEREQELLDLKRPANVRDWARFIHVAN